MTFDEALRRLDLSQINSIHLAVLEAAVAALLESHPDPGEAKRRFDAFYPKMQTAAIAVSPGEESAVTIVAAHVRARIFEKKG